MSFHEVTFWFAAVIAIGSAAMVLLTRGIVHMAFWLLLSLAGFAGLYLHLGADFLGFVQVVVYIGGILVLFLFGVMLTHQVEVPLRAEASWRFVLPGAVAGLGMLGFLTWLVVITPWRVEDPAPPEPTAAGVGERFMSTYLLPFEVVSVLLLVAMIGATYVARSQEEEPEEGSGEGGTP